PHPSLLPEGEGRNAARASYFASRFNFLSHLLPLGEELKMRAKEWAWERIKVRAESTGSLQSGECVRGSKATRVPVAFAPILSRRPKVRRPVKSSSYPVEQMPVTLIAIRRHPALSSRDDGDR